LIFRRIAAAYAIVVCVLVSAPASAQSLSAKLPLNQAIHIGKLPNGLSYYVRSNDQPAKRVSLRLAVKAGSIDEADDQRGLAHMLEHMAFNGTTHFKPGELVAYFESVGVAFGPHVNAYTSYDETVYMLNVPTDRAGALDRGLQALSDVAGGMSLMDKEIDKERGVVLEEWRQRLGVASRLQGITDRAVYGRSKYAERLPIGLPDTIQRFPYQRLRDFYRDNYTPDRIAIIVVGDLDAAAAEQLIRQYFAPIPKRKSAKRPVYPVPAHNDTRVAVATDSEAQSSSLSVFHTRPLRKSQTVGDYRRDLVRSLFEAMLNARLAEIARRPDAPFLGASSGDDTLGQTVEAFGVSARVNEGGIAKGIDALEQELARVRQFGFGDAELERVKKATLASYERAYNERDKSESPGLASELVALFLNDVPAPGIVTEYELAKRFVPTITTTETAALARELVTDTNRVVIVVAPEKKGVTPPTEAAVREALRSGAAATLTAWRDDANGKELLPTKPDAWHGDGAARDSRNRRHHPYAVKRRDRLVEANGFQKRSDHLHQLGERRTRQCAGGGISQRDVDDEPGRHIGCRRPVAGRSRQDAVGADRECLAVDGSVYAWGVGFGDAKGHRNIAPVAVPVVHRRQSRSRMPSS
jgi:zinc protease